MKKFVMIIICLCMFVLCGCSVPTQYTLEQNENGEVTQTIYVPFSVQELVEFGIDSATATSIASDIKNKLDTEFTNRYLNFKTKLENDDGLQENEKIIMLSYCPSVTSMLGKGLLFGNSSRTGITYEFKFKNALGYYYFNTNFKYKEMLEELKKDDAKIVHKFLTTDKIYTNQTIYSVNVEYATTMTFANYLNAVSKDVLKEYLQSSSLTTEQKEEIYDQVPPKEFIYRYGTSSRRLHSDADLVKNVNGMYYHEWNINLENSTREISTWNTYANAKAWYGLALGVTLVLVVVLMFVFGKEKKVQ